MHLTGALGQRVGKYHFCKTKPYKRDSKYYILKKKILNIPRKCYFLKRKFYKYKENNKVSNDIP